MKGPGKRPGNEGIGRAIGFLEVVSVEKAGRALCLLKTAVNQRVGDALEDLEMETRDVTTVVGVDRKMVETVSCEFARSPDSY